MAVPGPITLNSLTPGVASLVANYTQTNPAEADRLYIQAKLSSDIEWTTAQIFEPSTFTVWGLASVTSYDVRVRAINDVDGYGPWSNILTQTTLVDSFGPPLISYDETGVLPGPFVNNTGTLGAQYDLDTQHGSGLSNQVRNGRDVWQSSGQGGLELSTIPASTVVSQPLTIYVALQIFMADGNNRRLWVDHTNNMMLMWQNTGFIMARQFGGIYNVGTPTADGRLYVLEAIFNGSGSSLRVLDDQGNDSGVVTGNLNTSPDVYPASMAWDLAGQAATTGVGQYMESALYSGIGTTAEREARIEELFQKWSFDAPDIIPYTTGDSSASLDASTAQGSGALPEVGNVASTLQDITPSISGTYVDTASVDTTLADVTPTIIGGVELKGFAADILQDVTPSISGVVTLGGAVTSTLQDITPTIIGGVEIVGALGKQLINVKATITGSVEVPPPAPLVAPESPDLLRVFGHVLPVGEAFKLQ